MDKEKINPDTVAKPAAPYSGMVKVNGAKAMMFLSGISAIDKNYQVIGTGDILAQTRQIIDNIKLTLAASGAKTENVVMTTTYVLSDHMDEFLMSGASGELFIALDNPADTLVGVASLAGMKYGTLIEVSVIAVMG